MIITALLFWKYEFIVKILNYLEFPSSSKPLRDKRDGLVWKK